MLRRFLVVCILASLLGSLTFIRSNTSQASDDVSIGDAPTADEFSAASVGDPGEISLASASVDPSSRANAQSFYYSQYTAAPAIGWTGSYSGCTAGTTSSSFKSAMLQRLIYYRAMAGVPSGIGLSSTFSSKDQAAALMFSAQGGLTHDPPSSWACYTSTADEAAGSSNIALGASGTTALDLYMRDPGSNNAAVGHRRWILYPQTQTFGTGDTTASGGKLAANALWVFDGNYGSTRPATRDGYVAWPNKGYVPYQVVPTRWSLSYPGANFSGATVTVTLNGQPVQVAKEGVVTGYGENTIVWQMEGRSDGAAWPQPSSDKKYHVKITGVGGSTSTFEYDVTVFDPATAGVPTPTPVNSAVSLSTYRAISSTVVTYQLNGFSPNQPVSILWYRLTGSTSPITTDAQTNSSGAATGTFKVPGATGGPNQQVKFTAGSVSHSVYFNLVPRIKINTDPAIRGEPVDVSLRGYGKKEEVRIRWLNDNTWVEVARVMTSNTGSANIDVIVPEWAATGMNSVRGDSPTNRQQTNVVNVQGDVLAATPGGSPVASVTATATETVTVEVPVTETVTETATATEAPTEIPTEAPTEIPTEVPTEVPTEIPTEIPTEVPTEVPTEATP